MISMYKQKKKRAVDPNAPPRPTLLGHEKVIKDTKQLLQKHEYEIGQLRELVRELESKLAHQTNYLNTLHRVIQGLIK